MIYFISRLCFLSSTLNLNCPSNPPNNEPLALLLAATAAPVAVVAAPLEVAVEEPPMVSTTNFTAAAPYLVI